MERLARTMIFGSAMVAAVVLCWLGLRNVKTKRGLLMSALLVALSLAGCSVATQSVEEEKETVTQPPEKKASRKIPGRMVEVKRTTAWKEFKAFWTKLDAVDPLEHDADTSRFYGEYYEAISHNQANELDAELATLMEGIRTLVEQDKLKPIEADLLESVCATRIQMMAYGSRLMLTRMAMPPSAFDKEDTIKSLESRIDTLIALRQKSTVDTEQFDKALALVQRDIGEYSVLDTIGDRYLRHIRDLGSHRETGAEEMLAAYMAELDKQHADTVKSSDRQQAATTDAREQVEKARAETKRALAELKESLPFIDAMVADLEQ